MSNLCPVKEFPVVFGWHFAVWIRKRPQHVETKSGTAIGTMTVDIIPHFCSLGWYRACFRGVGRIPVNHTYFPVVFPGAGLHYMGLGILRKNLSRIFQGNGRISFWIINLWNSLNDPCSYERCIVCIRIGPHLFILIMTADYQNLAIRQRNSSWVPAFIFHV